MQNITYTDFNKVDSIISDQYTLKINYGLGNDRITQKQYARNGSTGMLLSTKTYVGGLTEIIEPRESSSTTINYINSPEGLVAIEITQPSGSIDWYWVFTDHLGSITSLVRESDGQKFEMSFDAWGNRRDPATWNNYSATPSNLIVDRGFTGHEHLDYFNLINMNGRVYDPVIARFLSPDGFIQAPGLAQNYNGYTYCLNNPLIYTDPSGKFFLGTLLTFTIDFFRTIFVNGGIDPWNTSKNRSEAWKEFDPTAKWSRTNKAWKIDMGGFVTDPNRTIAGRGLQLISRWTWELPQTILGKGYSRIRNITGNVDDVSYYGGATLVNKNDNSGWRWGLTLGPYINSKNVAADPYTDDIFRHEFGHTLQSRLIGPLYLTHVGIPSFIGSGLENIGLNDHNREWYETQANRMSERYFSNHDPGALTALQWDDNEYPRNYNPNWYWLFAHPPVPFIWWLFF